MRKCPACRAELSETSLGCRNCLARASRAALLARQEQYIPAVIGGAMLLQLARQSNTEPWHLELFGSDHQQAYCGAELARHGMKRNRTAYSESLRMKLCGPCVAVFDQTWRAAEAATRK